MEGRKGGRRRKGGRKKEELDESGSCTMDCSHQCGEHPQREDEYVKPETQSPPGLTRNEASRAAGTLDLRVISPSPVSIYKTNTTTKPENGHRKSQVPRPIPLVTFVSTELAASCEPHNRTEKVLRMETKSPPVLSAILLTAGRCEFSSRGGTSCSAVTGVWFCTVRITLMLTTQLLWALASTL